MMAFRTAGCPSTTQVTVFDAPEPLTACPKAAVSVPTMRRQLAIETAPPNIKGRRPSLSIKKTVGMVKATPRAYWTLEAIRPA